MALRRLDRGFDSVHMNRNGIFNLARISACQRDGRWNLVSLRVTQDKRIAPRQSLHSHCEPAQLIFLIGIRSRHVKEQLRRELLEAAMQVFFENCQVIRVTDPVRQIYVQC